MYEHAVSTLNQEDTDPLRLAFHMDTLSSDGLALLQALEVEKEESDQCIPKMWLHNAASILGDVYAQLHRVKEAASGR